MASIKVVIADDQPLVRNGLRATLADIPEIEVLGEAQHGQEAVQMARLLRPGVVLMDIDMPRMDGVEATRLITSDPREPAPRVLILTVYEQDEYVFEALRAGASGFLLKTTPTEKIVEAVRAVAEGSAMLPPTATRHLTPEFARPPSGAAGHAPAPVASTQPARRVCS